MEPNIARLKENDIVHQTKIRFRERTRASQFGQEINEEHPLKGDLGGGLSLSLYILSLTHLPHTYIEHHRHPSDRRIRPLSHNTNLIVPAFRVSGTAGINVKGSGILGRIKWRHPWDLGRIARVSHVDLVSRSHFWNNLKRPVVCLFLKTRRLDSSLVHLLH
ncbi:hypothetical protein LXL04_013468 [Taraxacum kok-saghyz]